jgi:hypothetical protein
MDIHKLLAELRAESKRLDQIIQTLEWLTDSDRMQPRPAIRRGRKSMDEESRRQVSQRMKRYWAQRRKSPPAAPSAGDGLES